MTGIMTLSTVASKRSSIRLEIAFRNEERIMYLETTDFSLILFFVPGRRRENAMNPLLPLRFETADSDIINNFFHFFDVVLETVETLSQRVVLQIEKSKSVVQFSEKRGNLNGTTVVSSRHAIHSKSSLGKRENKVSCTLIASRLIRQVYIPWVSV